MNPGRLDRLAQLYALRENTGEAGSPRRVFAPPVAVWLGRIQARAALPADTQGGKRVDAETVFLARFNPAIAAGARLKVDGQTYEITGAVEVPPPAPRRQQMHVTCRALVGAQPIPTA
jgi:head-tail adaptor